MRSPEIKCIYIWNMDRLIFIAIPLCILTFNRKTRPYPFLMASFALFFPLFASVEWLLPLFCYCHCWRCWTFENVFEIVIRVQQFSARNMQVVLTFVCRKPFRPRRSPQSHSLPTRMWWENCYQPCLRLNATLLACSFNENCILNETNECHSILINLTTLNKNHPEIVIHDFHLVQLCHLIESN